MLRYTVNGMSIAEFVKNHKNGSGYIEVRITNGERKLLFYTNGYGQGMFFRRSDGTYHQTRGTCQFSICATSASNLRRQLKSEFEYFMSNRF